MQGVAESSHLVAFADAPLLEVADNDDLVDQIRARTHTSVNWRELVYQLTINHWTHVRLWIRWERIRPEVVMIQCLCRSDSRARVQCKQFIEQITRFRANAMKS